MLIGADCSVATEPVAELAHNWNLVQVSYESHCLRDNQLATYVFKTVALLQPEFLLVHALWCITSKLF